MRRSVSTRSTVRQATTRAPASARRRPRPRTRACAGSRPARCAARSSSSTTRITCSGMGRASAARGSRMRHARARARRRVHLDASRRGRSRSAGSPRGRRPCPRGFVVKYRSKILRQVLGRDARAGVATSIECSCASRAGRAITRPPAGVASMAFRTRLSSAWRSWSGSTRRCRRAGLRPSLTPRASASARATRRARPRTGRVPSAARAAAAAGRSRGTAARCRRCGASRFR